MLAQSLRSQRGDENLFHRFKTNVLEWHWNSKIRTYLARYGIDTKFEATFSVTSKCFARDSGNPTQLPSRRRQHQLNRDIGGKEPYIKELSWFGNCGAILLIKPFQMINMAELCIARHRPCKLCPHMPAFKATWGCWPAIESGLGSWGGWPDGGTRSSERASLSSLVIHLFWSCLFQIAVRTNSKQPTTLVSRSTCQQWPRCCRVRTLCRSRSTCQQWTRCCRVRTLWESYCHTV